MKKYIAATAFEIGQVAYRAARAAGDSRLLSRVQAILTLEKCLQEAGTAKDRLKWLSGIGTHLSMLEREQPQTELEKVYRSDMLLAYESGTPSDEAMQILRGLREQIAQNRATQLTLF